jgi:hypothetical protein
MARSHDSERQRRIDDQADKVAELIGANPETVMSDGNYGVSLTPDQLDKLLALIPTEKCTCRCREGKHCGGCGHDGCGYSNG